MWPTHVFCKFWIEYPVLLMQIISFVIKLSFGLVLCSVNNFQDFKLPEK